MKEMICDTSFFTLESSSICLPINSTDVFISIMSTIIIIIIIIFMCYFSGEHIALSIKKNNNGVNIELGKTNRLKALCMMQINT